MQLFIVFLYNPFHFSKVCSMSPLSFFILVFCIFSFFLISLAKDLSILLIFPKNQLLVFLILFFLFPISFISTLIFIITFFLLDLSLTWQIQFLGFMNCPVSLEVHGYREEGHQIRILLTERTVGSCLPHTPKAYIDWFIFKKKIDY